RTLTFANHGTAPAVLDLSLTVTTVGGEPVPDGALALDTDTLTVAAGGTASVTVTLDPASVGSGRYTGRLVAVGADGLTVAAPVGFTVAEPMYTLHVDLPARAGADDFRHINVTVWGVDGSFTGESAQKV